jgi:nucleotide-binding universal stress UspA family protein
MFNRILVPLDGSLLAERAIPHAELFARIFGASIILLQVLEPTSYHENPKAVDPLSWQIRKAEADMYMQGIALRIRKNLGEKSLNSEGEKKSRVDYSIREGKTAENIVDFAHTENIDLLVISTHGSGGLSRWNISSVTQKVINLIYLPVLIVRAYNRSNTDESIIRYRRILLPIDSSRRAECSLSAGIELARGEMSTGNPPDNAGGESKLVLAAVIRPPEIPIPEPFPVEISQLSEQLLQVSREAVYKYLYEMKERLPVDCDTCVVENASVASAIQELADQEDIDMVVLCAHGYSGQVTWPYGTVARNYIEHGTKPVLVVQDVLRSEVRPTAAEVAAEKSGRR